MNNLEINNILTDTEKEAISKFIDNDIMFKSVKKVILSAIYFDGTIQKEGIPDPLNNFMLALVATNSDKSYEELGKKVEASLAGVQLLVKGFQKLEQYSKRKEPKKEEPNPAR